MQKISCDYNEWKDLVLISFNETVSNTHYGISPIEEIEKTTRTEVLERKHGRISRGQNMAFQKISLTLM